MNLFEQLRETIATTLDVPENQVSENTAAGDFAAWDSLGQVNLMMTLEQTFDLTLDVDDFARLDSVPLILEYLHQQGIEA